MMTAVGASGEPALGVHAARSTRAAASEARVWQVCQSWRERPDHRLTPGVQPLGGPALRCLQRRRDGKGGAPRAHAHNRKASPGLALASPRAPRRPQTACATTEPRAGRTCLGRREPHWSDVRVRAVHRTAREGLERQVRPACAAPAPCWRICQSQRLSASRALHSAFSGRTKRARARRLPPAESRALRRTAAAVLRSALPGAAPPGGGAGGAAGRVPRPGAWALWRCRRCFSATCSARSPCSPGTVASPPGVATASAMAEGARACGCALQCAVVLRRPHGAHTEADHRACSSSSAHRRRVSAEVRLFQGGGDGSVSVPRAAHDASRRGMHLHQRRCSKQWHAT